MTNYKGQMTNCGVSCLRNHPAAVGGHPFFSPQCAVHSPQLKDKAQSKGIFSAVGDFSTSLRS
ncbi:MAG: hypothetical protein LBL66_07545 [Clostridiales bacterium]|nr:hypothetical protein [Clostridiales bacterium]